MSKKKVNVLVDWGKAFVDKDGNFYCGTTEEQKDNAVLILKEADLIVYASDVHSRNSMEFIANGGIYPAHNIVGLYTPQDADRLSVGDGKTVSPQLTDKLYDLVKDKNSGLIVPRHVFFQDYNGEPDFIPAFTFQDVVAAFDVPKLNPQEFLDGGIEYVVNAKHMFNGASLQSTEWMDHIPGKPKVAGVPSMEMNVFTLLKQQYGQGEGLQFDVTGVVIGICIYQTASNLRQLFPKADINVIADGCTHLVYAPLGIATPEQGDQVASAMCKQVGVNYVKTVDYLGMK